MPLGEVTVRVAILTAELVAAQQRVEDERAHTDARLADQRDAFEDRVAQLRADVERITAAAAQLETTGRRSLPDERKPWTIQSTVRSTRSVGECVEVVAKVVNQAL